MGKLTSDGQDQANLLAQAELSAANAATPWLAFLGTANLAISGDGVGSVVLERSFDGGVTAIPATNLGATVTFTGPASEIILNREQGVLHRLRAATLSSGSFLARLSQ
jgi:hypothetical protein